MSSLCQDICQIAFTSKLVMLFIIYPGARLNCYQLLPVILPELLLLFCFFLFLFLYTDPQLL